MNSARLYPRRDWLKRFAVGAAASLSAPHWAATLLAETGDPTPGPAVLRLRLTDYPPLAVPGGSIQLNFNEIAKPFTLNRVSPESFVTLDSVCTHSGCTVGRFIVADGRMRCPCHGSRYDIEGRVFRDENGASTEPAPDDLNRFATDFDSTAGIVSITLPGIALGVRSIEIQPQSPTGRRVKLRFAVTAYSTYEIHHQPALGGEFTRIPFATSSTGNVTQLSIQPTADGDLDAYLDAPDARGFYVVGLVLAPA